MSGNKLYTIEFLERVIKNDIPSLSKKVKLMLEKAVEERLAVDPIKFGKPLQYGLKGQRRLRVSNYRIIYRVEALKHNIVIVSIKHRRDVYE